MQPLPAPVSNPIDKPDEKRATNDVPYRYWNQVSENKVMPGEIRVVRCSLANSRPKPLRCPFLRKKSDGDEIHIGDTVLKTSGHKSGDRENNGEYLVGDVPSTKA